MLVEFHDLGVRTPLDPVLSLTRLMDRLPGHCCLWFQDVFRITVWILDHCCCCTFVLAVFVLCPLGSASCFDFGCFGFVYVKLFVVRSIIRVVCFCVKLMSAGPMKGRLDFFWKNVRCVYKKWMDDAFKGEWMCDAFIRWMDDALRMSECTMRFMKWMDDAF